MSSRKVRHNGQMRKASDIISRTKKYKYNKSGSLVELGTSNSTSTIEKGSTYIIKSLGNTSQAKWNALAGTSGLTYAVNDKFVAARAGESGDGSGTVELTLGDTEFKVVGSKSSLRRIADLERNVSLLINQLTTTDGDTEDDDDVDFDNNVNKDTKFKKDVQLGNGSSDNIDVEGHLDIKNGLTLGSSAQEVFRDLVGGMAGTGLTHDDSGNTINVDTSEIATRSHVSSNYVGDGSVQALASDANVLTFSANTLTLKRGDGSTDTVNLSAYLDDTNAARITSGTMASDGTATFTRDDNTTFTVDMSVLLDDTNLSRITNAAFDTGNGVLTLTRNDTSTVTVDLDNRYHPIGTYDNYLGWDLYVEGTSRGRITTTENVNFVGGTNVSLDYAASNNTITINSSDANTDTLQSISSTNSNGTYYPSFVSSTSGAQTGLVDSNFTYNPSTNTLTATNFEGTATKAKYADLAERYAADAPYAEGTVVAFGGEAEVTASSSFAQRSIAGVVSFRPAFAMNSEAGNNETHPYIALQGRVPVKVTGDVKKGDILVASDVAGTATAWTNEDADPRMTAYVGIAISDAVDGMVEVKVGK